MKYLILILIFLSCKEQEKGQFVEKGSPTETRQFLTENIEGDLQLFVAFFWPKEIQKNESTIVESIIKDSLKISSKKNSYFEQKQKVQCEYEQASCDCNIDIEMCEPGQRQDPSRKEYCEQKQSELDDIEMIIIEVAVLIESLKNQLNEFKTSGQWLDTHLDVRDSFFVPYINLKEQKFKIPILGDERISYSTEMGEITNFQFNDPTITMSVLEKKIINDEPQLTGNIIDAKVDILNKKHLYQFMGELTKEENGILRRGIIYFELPKPEKNCTN